MCILKFTKIRKQKDKVPGDFEECTLQPSERPTKFTSYIIYEYTHSWEYKDLENIFQKQKYYNKC